MRRVREMLFEQLGVTDTNDLFATYAVLWRGTKREVEVLFENVREMSDEKLRGRPGTWTVVIDFPFDDPKFYPPTTWPVWPTIAATMQTLVWMPSFFSAKAQHDLGRLVVLDYILTGERFNERPPTCRWWIAGRRRRCCATSVTSCSSGFGSTWRWPTALPATRATPW